MFLLFLPFMGFSSHIMGSDLTYKCLGDKKYKVSAKVYRDCRGVRLDNVYLYTDIGIEGAISLMRLISVKNITGSCIFIPPISKATISILSRD